MLQNATSYNNATVGSGSVVNDVLFEYNSFGQLAGDYQAHSGAATTGSPGAQYDYADGSANTIRRTSTTYPSGRVLNYNYGTSGEMNDILSRVRSLIDNDGSTHLVDYAYVGTNRAVVASSPQPGTELTYIKLSGEPDGDGGDKYTGWDRFSRVIDQRWIQTSTGTALERIQYGFDQANNRVWRDNLVADGSSADQDEYYTYDGLYQVATLKRGQLNGGKTGISGTPTWEEDFTLDATGNWDNYLTKTSGTTTLNQNRTYNKANGLSTIAGASTYTSVNAAGNSTVAPVPGSWTSAYDLTYDAWNRPIGVVKPASSSSSSSSSSSTIATYAYDGLDRRITKATSSVRHYYYSNKWQILEERVGSSTSADRQFVWGQRYIDDLVLRDQSSTRLYAFHDYFNCTAVVNTSGTVEERYGYNAFGQPRVMTPTFGSRASSSYTWETLYGDYRWDSETGLYQVRNRYLHSPLGRWINRDPIGYQGGINLYAYVGNDPPNNIDKFGLQKCPKGLHGIGPALHFNASVTEHHQNFDFTLRCPKGCMVSSNSIKINVQPTYACLWTYHGTYMAALTAAHEDPYTTTPGPYTLHGLGGSQTIGTANCTGNDVLTTWFARTRLASSVYIAGAASCWQLLDLTYDCCPC